MGDRSHRRVPVLRPASDRASPAGLADAFRDIRRRRRLGASKVATRMGLGLRAYQDFEAGRVAPSLRKVRAFADIVDCDACALAVAVVLDRRDLALACADNKMMTLAALRVGDLRDQMGPAFTAMTAGQAMAMLESDWGGVGDIHTSATGAPEPPEPALLTERQVQCLRWVQAGKSSSVIGQLLNLSSRTVDGHIEDACRRLGVQTRVQAVCAAMSLDLLS